MLERVERTEPVRMVVVSLFKTDEAGKSIALDITAESYLKEVSAFFGMLAGLEGIYDTVHKSIERIRLVDRHFEIIATTRPHVSPHISA